MNINWDRVGPEGLAFFGAMSASISHELKNALAVIYENSGLLEDVVLMAERGMTMEPEKLVTLSQRITGQVKRVDRIIDNLNSFAHSVDYPLKKSDIGSLIDLAVALTARNLAAQKVRVDVTEVRGPVAMMTSPFLFINLVGRCLEAVAGLADQDKVIHLSCSGIEREAALIFSGLDSVVVSEFPGDPERALLKALNAEIRLETERNFLCLNVTEILPST